VGDEFDLAAIEEEAAEAQHDAIQAAHSKRVNFADDGTTEQEEDSKQKTSLQQQGNFAED
jgi:hypothetical protein